MKIILCNLNFYFHYFYWLKKINFYVIWTEPLLKPILPPKNLSFSDKVNKHIIMGQNNWNETLIRREFCEEDIVFILNIAIREQGSDDKLIWHFDKKWEINVRSAYRILINQNLHKKQDSDSSLSTSMSCKF